MDGRDRLLRALEELRDVYQSGESPDLSDAPMIDAWGLAPAGDVVVLVGLVTGHPTIADGAITTSPVLSIADDRTWARTVSRFYRLGRSLQEVVDDLH